MTNALLNALRRVFELRAARDPAWLAEHRASAMARVVELGLPTRRDEAWRFTDIAAAHRRLCAERSG